MENFGNEIEGSGREPQEYSSSVILTDHFGARAAADRLTRNMVEHVMQGRNTDPCVTQSAFAKVYPLLLMGEPYHLKHQHLCLKADLEDGYCVIASKATIYDSGMPYGLQFVSQLLYF